MTTPELPFPPFDPNAPQQQRPRLRPVRAFPAQMGEHVALGLADAKQISEKVVFVAPAVQVILPLLDGNRGLDQIVAEVGRGLTRGLMEQLVAQLDDAGLLFGPRYDAMLAKMRADFDASDVLPPGTTAGFTDAIARGELGEEAFATADAAARDEAARRKLPEIFDQWITAALENADEPSFNTLPKAVVAPHLDYLRGWQNYAAVYGRMRVADRPDRVIILGTNHFGDATGICACNKGYQTLFGTCEVDRQALDMLRTKLGDAVLANRFDHEREHSIELHIPWIQHCIGKDENGKYPKVLGVLVHDPAVNNGESYDGTGVGLEPFIAAMREIVAALPGRTLLVSSADLSHVGPAFGDAQPLAGDTPEAEGMRNRVFQHDREMLELVRTNKPEELVAAMAWQQNPTRWCSTGNIVAALKITQPEEVEVFNYIAAMDEQGAGMVCSVSMAMR